MGTKQIRVSEALYARVESEKRPEESLGEALERMLDTYGLVDFADDVAAAAEAWDTAGLERQFEAADRENRRALEDELP